MTTITKKMMIVLTLCSLSGIAHAAQKNKGFWSRLAGLCHAKSSKIQPQKNIRYQEDDEEKNDQRPYAPMRNAFEHRATPQESPNSNGREIQLAPLPALDLTLKFNASNASRSQVPPVPAVKPLRSSQTDTNNLILPLPQIDPREEELQRIKEEKKRIWTRERSVTFDDLQRRPSLDAVQAKQLLEAQDQDNV